MIDLLKVRAVFVKEMRDSLRDRRTLFATIIVPVLMYPLMMLVVSEAAQVAKAKRASEQYRVAVQPPELRAQVEALVQTYLPREEEAPGPAGDDPAKTPLLQPAAEREPEEAPQLLFQTSPNATEALKAGELQAILNVPREFVALLDAPLAPDERTETLDIQLFYDGAEHRSRQARDLLHEALDAYRKDVLNRRLAARDLEHSFLLPFRIDEGREYNVASAEKQTGSALGTLLPLLFIFVLITGALSPAIDLTVGEKERSTLETLIAAPVRPLEVIAGKFLTVATLAMLNACLNLTSFTLTFLAVGADRLMDFHFPWSALPATLLLLLPLGFFFSALMLAACSFATNYKEAQVFVLPIYVVPMIGLMVVTIPGIELEGPLLVAPVLNTALLIRELFLDRPNLLQPFLFVLVSTCLYAAAAVALAARIFAREEVLFQRKARCGCFSAGASSGLRRTRSSETRFWCWRWFSRRGSTFRAA
ncbi:MAG: ABC transporter permease subunit [Planctomycetota bacterium]|nr:ABC transporter permease subunit [Planctomycetota bacterium]